MTDKEKEAYWKGYNDRKAVLQGRRSYMDAYNPPREHEEAYKAGWKRAEEER